MVTKACTKCHRLMDEDRCAVCNLATSKNWSGFLIIVDPEESTIAQELKINLPGEYALRVR
ncbi:MULTISPECIES: transcription elongation factor subunit Spt4 [Methanobacterium]|jgi:DNA-directed RNA polymerase subunit E"|uniref:Transcription elongation factor Spt4 n=1 Tax=Methanobacterium formicicum TaxID=2162 RepID=A0A090I765_METFO|nr:MULTISPECIES: transcription elongation factor subunit Spt4 [Methanobacterium]AIS31432.1 DNA-directed RNA polymerase subunit E'' RpoE2 [Methanobacterium formicicum]AXV40811.1 MAG: DNA-directed RNA polymerase subunit E'' [Methanobacterium sp. BAmetb5]KUK73580.1 MAG: DNA-dependent RNA polymerase subunit E [Methanobacterium sp. 42_16]MBF4475673.1 DNA-directed RNA polymerase, subunit E'' [Methanobacterium formicicum]MDD4811122.1 DNA-directed RNA polymerase, subunit E'' [Methanobacterium formicic